MIGRCPSSTKRSRAGLFSSLRRHGTLWRHFFSFLHIDNGGWINSLFPHIGGLRRPIANISGIDGGNQGSSIGIGSWTLFREKRAT